MGRFAGTIYQQAKQVGVIEMICDFRGIQFIDKADTLYRVLHWGEKTTKKENFERMKLIGITDDNEADALVAALATYEAIKNIVKKKKKK